MKKKIIFASMLTICSFAMDAQWDNQWMVIDSKGKNSVVPNSNPELNDYFNPITNSTFNISGYHHPQTTQGKNCLFVIYDDGSYFNSRYIPKSSFFTPPAINPQNFTTHNFTAPSGKKAVAVYATRTYEGDDPPKGIRANNGPSSDPTILYYNLGLSDSNDTLLTANHAVVRNRDITLIINLQKLRSLLIPNPASHLYAQCTLRVDSLKLKVGGKVPLANCFSLIPVFYSAQFAGTPSTAYHAIGNSSSVLIDPNDPSSFLFLNLRPTSTLDNYYHDSQGNNLYQTVFQIQTDNGHVLGEFHESLLDSYDPNYLVIDSICTSRLQNDKYLFYHINFENTGNMAANQFKVILDFPKGIDTKCTPMGDWKIGNNSFNANIIRHKKSYEIILNSADLPLLEPCDERTQDKSICQAFLNITFKMKKSNYTDNHYTDEDLYPNHARVYFADRPYELSVQKEVDIHLPRITINGQTLPGHIIKKIPRPIIYGDCRLNCNR